RKATRLGTKRNNLLGQYDIHRSLQSDEGRLCRLFLNAAETISSHDGEPEAIIESFHLKCERDGIPIAWSLFFYLLWLYQPRAFFPIKITIIRDTAKELGFEIKEGSLSADGAKAVFRFIDDLREKLADLKP